jgi:hypothetical protein
MNNTDPCALEDNRYSLGSGVDSRFLYKEIAATSSALVINDMLKF